MKRQGYRWWALVGTAVLALCACLLQVGLAGQPTGEAPEWWYFVGRLHPLIVHLPIGILILVAALELGYFLGFARDALSRTLDLIQPIALLSCFGGFLVGHLLGLEGGFSAGRLEEHRNLAFVTVLVSCAQCFAWSRIAGASGGSRRRSVYRVTLLVNLLVLSAAAHVGGTLSRGESYLARYAPSWAKPLLGGAEKEVVERTAALGPEPGTEALVFAHAVQPMLQKYCTECHGSQQAKGGLRTDSIEALLAGGDSGPSVVAGAPDASPLVTRSELPHDHEDSMPPDGEPRPSAAQISLLRFWVARGMDQEARLRDLLLPEEARSAVEQALARAVSPANAAVVPEVAPRVAPPAEAANPEEVEESVEGEVMPESSEEQAESLVPEPSAFQLVQEKCVDCHGPSKQKARLRVDSIEHLFKGGRNGPGIVSGAPTQGSVVSALLAPLASKEHMPPKNKPQFTAAEQGKVVSWLRALARPKSGASGASSESVEQQTESAASGEQALESSGSEPDVAVRPVDIAALCAEPAPPPPGQSLLFDELVLPILGEKCTSCHDAGLPSGGLNLATCEAVLTGGDAGASVVPGDAAASLLVRRLRLAIDDEEHMPPADYPQLAPEEQELVELWIEKGARRDSLVTSEGNSAAISAKQAQAQAEQTETVTPPGRRGGGGLCTLGRSTGGSGLLIVIFMAWFARVRRRGTLVL